jgi:hypothetical protein
MRRNMTAPVVALAVRALLVAPAAGSDDARTRRAPTHVILEVRVVDPTASCPDGACPEPQVDVTASPSATAPLSPSGRGPCRRVPPTTLASPCSASWPSSPFTRSAERQPEDTEISIREDEDEDAARALGARAPTRSPSACPTTPRYRM